MLLVLLALSAFSGLAVAHESRPAYLELKELSPNRYALLWRTPVLVGQPLPVALRLPESFHSTDEPITQRLRDSLLERRVIETDADGIAGKRIDIVGLQATITDVLVRIEYLNGEQATIMVHPSQAWVDIPEAQSKFAILTTYVLHGIDHILEGFDHLLFVLALILIVRNTRTLIWTITAFTAAHSITLTLATLGVVHVPGAPVEATIALSIVLLAYEIFRVRQGKHSATARWPWMVAFSFGLLHGFGFAGALTNLGLPQNEVPLALFAFNVGVELGQLAFIAGVLSVIWVAKQFNGVNRARDFALPTTVYAIGGLACFWLFERVAAIVFV